MTKSKRANTQKISRSYGIPSQQMLIKLSSLDNRNKCSFLHLTRDGDRVNVFCITGGLENPRKKPIGFVGSTAIKKAVETNRLEIEERPYQLCPQQGKKLAGLFKK